MVRISGFAVAGQRCVLRVNEDTPYLSITSVAAKFRTAIVRNINVSVGICAKNSIIFMLRRRRASNCVCGKKFPLSLQPHMAKNILGLEFRITDYDPADIGG